MNPLAGFIRKNYTTWWPAPQSWKSSNYRCVNIYVYSCKWCTARTIRRMRYAHGVNINNERYTRTRKRFSTGLRAFMVSLLLECNYNYIGHRCSQGKIGWFILFFPRTVADQVSVGPGRAFDVCGVVYGFSGSLTSQDRGTPCKHLLKPNCPCSKIV